VRFKIEKDLMQLTNLLPGSFAYTVTHALYANAAGTVSFAPSNKKRLHQCIYCNLGILYALCGPGVPN
jgi:hypothetical protein